MVKKKLKKTMSIAEIKKEHFTKELTKSSVDSDPIIQFNQWLKEALVEEGELANAMILSTVSKEGNPTARVVLLKGEIRDGFVFFSNYSSEKASQLASNPNASLTFFWKKMERQVRVEGKIEKVTKKESENYFKSRPRKSRIGAVISNQSKPILSRSHLVQKFALKTDQLAGKEVPMPDFWGGYRLIPERVEFWQGRESRLHDRINYKRIVNGWKIERLSP